MRCQHEGVIARWGLLATAGVLALSALPVTAAAAASDISLVVRVDSGDGTWSRVTLRCDPAGGTHPRRARACAALLAAGRGVLAPVPPDRMCTQQYGGPERARITGVWRGKTVDARFNRTDGCQIARWNALGVVFTPLLTRSTNVDLGQ